MSMGFTIHNDNIDKTIDEVHEDLSIALENVGIVAERYAVEEIENNPRRVDTGLLRNSITYALGGSSADKSSYRADNPKQGRPSSGSYSGTMPGKKWESVSLGSNLEYAAAVHFGSSTLQPPNPFIYKAFNNHMDEYKNIIKDELSN